MASEFIALTSTCKEAEWLNDLVSEVPIWPKSMAPISIYCDSESTLSKAYNHVYNDKSRHIGVRHNYVLELISFGVDVIDFVRSDVNLAYPFTKAMPRDMVYKTLKEMRLKPLENNQK
ncbi:unnamed protein product [Cuscuta europaea]|uniref:Retrovirus-related Pol polyprotein from transposon TNT 1-94 n=1 Tax=Cuscuta europaea TaxID=41803 RepID=A0A9P1A0N8_CUSEU|nr:unnamed protein product [Cuscuta europaea]